MTTLPHKSQRTMHVAAHVHVHAVYSMYTLQWACGITHIHVHVHAVTRCNVMRSNCGTALKTLHGFLFGQYNPIFKTFLVLMKTKEWFSGNRRLSGFQATINNYKQLPSNHGGTCRYGLLSHSGIYLEYLKA
jgi:hypothetical protein